MRASFLPPVVLCLALFGCTSDESEVCERFGECDLLPSGLSVTECEDQAVRQVPEDRLSQCADCVEENDCNKVADACRKYCRPGD